MTSRYKVTFKLLYQDNEVSYEVCSLNGEMKAIVIACQMHSVSGSGHILSVSVDNLGGDQPENTDLIDRMEW